MKYIVFILSLLIADPAMAQVSVPNMPDASPLQNSDFFYIARGTTDFHVTYSELLSGITVSPCGSNGQVQYNNSGNCGGYTNTQLTALINNFSSSLSGAVPSSGGGTANFLRADGTWAAPSGSGTVTTSGSPSSGNLAKFSGASVVTNGDLSGDITTSGTLATTVAKITGTAVTSTTGTTNVVFDHSPTLVTPNIGAATLGGTLTASAQNIVTDTTTGTKIGTATNQKLGFYNASPIVQPTGDALTALSNLGLVATPTLSTADLPTNQPIRGISFTIDGGGSTITTGVKGFVTIPFACTITDMWMLGDQTGSIVVDVWKKAFTTTLPAVGNTITSSDVPTISSAITVHDSTLTGWTTSVSAGDMMGFNVNSVTTMQRVTITLGCKAT